MVLSITVRICQCFCVALLASAAAFAGGTSRLINLSARASVGTDATTLIGGFVIGPGGNATVLIRAVGPSLAAAPFFLAEAASDTTLTVFAAETGGRVIGANDDWKAEDASTFSAVGAFPFQSGSKDAALIVNLKPGSYTAHVTAKEASGGRLALLEIYEVDHTAGRLQNLSVRGQVGTGSGLIIAGFVVGEGVGASGVLVRAAGGALKPFGITEVLEDPTLAVTRSDNTIIIANDDWSGPVAQDASARSYLDGIFKQTGAFPLSAGSRDAAAVIWPATGAYTAQVRGVGDSTGVALVEIYYLSENLPVVDVIASKPNGDEDGVESVLFTITRTGNLEGELSVRYKVSGSAAPDLDYARLPGIVVLPAGVDRVELSPPLHKDNATEGAESVILTIEPDSFYKLGSSSVATAWIADGLGGFLEPARARYSLPGIAMAVFNSERVLAVGAAGTRKVGSGVLMLHTDSMQIASITKTMTATVVARLVEQGKLSWDSSLGQLYPELASTMSSLYRSVTIDMILRHQGGFPAWMDADTVVKQWTSTYLYLDNAGKRYEAVKYILSRSPAYNPGSASLYTNDGYLILGSICERITGVTWETLLKQMLFQPLGLNASGFGDPSADRSLDNVWGHIQQGRFFVPVDPQPESFGWVPFGTSYGVSVYSTVGDLAKYGIFHMRGDLGLENALSLASFRRLHHAVLTPIQTSPERYSAGFANDGELQSDGRWTNVQHWGNHGRGRTLFWFSPQNNIGVAVLTNGTDENTGIARSQIAELVNELTRRYRSNPP